MAINAAMVFEVRSTGDDTNGGGFRRGGSGTDRSQQDVAQVNIDNATITATTTAANSNIITFTGYAPTSADVGNIVNMASGTNITPGPYEITSVTGTTWTVSGAANLTTAGGAGAALVGKMGGAYLSLSKIGTSAVTGNTIYVKAGSYTINSTSNNVATGCYLNANQVCIEGYETTRGDMGTKPVFTASGISTFTAITQSGTRSMVRNIAVDCAGLTSSRAFLTRGIVYACKGSNATNSAFAASTTGYAVRCEATGCSTQTAYTLLYCVDCTAHDNTVTGFGAGGSSLDFIRCASVNNTGASSDGFNSAVVEAHYANCTTYGNGRDGFRIGDSACLVENCIAESNTGIGINISGGANQQLLNNAVYNNSGGDTSFGVIANIKNDGLITGTSSFFTNAAGGDFSLNNNAGGGALARYAGYAGVVPSIGTGYVDIGVLQHKGDTHGFTYSG